MSGADSFAGNNPEGDKQRTPDGAVKNPAAIRSGTHEEARDVLATRNHGGLDQSVTVESPGEHFHVTFFVKDLVEKARKYPVIDVEVPDLLWCLHERTLDPEQDEARAQKADLRHPIILFSNENGDIINIGDGTHRVQKAHALGHPTIKAHIIPIRDMGEFAA